MSDLTKSIYSVPDQGNTARLRRLEKGATYLRSNTAVPTPAPYTRAPSGLFVGNENQDFSLNVSNLSVVGAVYPLSITGNFAATAGTSNIHWYWDGTNGSVQLVINRSNGQKFPVPPSSLNVTGLSANTTYYFLPFWPTSAACAIGWANGTVGTPQIAFTSITDATATAGLAAQNLVSREPLTQGFMSYTTPASGTNSGNGGGGGAPGKCVMTGTDIEPLGDWVFNVEIHPETDWVLLHAETYSLSCTRDHPICTPNRGFVPADHLAVGDLVITRMGEAELDGVEWYRRPCTKQSVSLPKGHLFWANGFLSHNIKLGG